MNGFVQTLNDSSYEPPVWVPENIQRRLRTSHFISDIFVLGYELWESSGGSKQGFVAFLEFCRFLDDKDLCSIGFKITANIWNGFKKKSPTCPFQTYDPMRDAQFTCKSCFSYLFRREYCDFCMDSHQEFVKESVVNFVLNEC